MTSTTPTADGPITPPPTPISHAYPSPTSSSSKSTSSNSSQQRPSLKPSFSTKSTSIRENVQVMVRCRPRSRKELEIDEEPCWLIRPDEGTIELARLKSPNSISTFQYDNVVMGVDNEQVYKAGILDLVRSAMMGYNGTVFAYGQTASGKTYTMMGTEAEPGVIPRAVREVFSYIEEDTGGREYLLRVSYMEIYNEKIKDLLNSENTSPEIVEDKKGVYVRNLKEVIVKTAQEVINCIKEGEGNRHISATDYNEHSSRSHTIFQLVIESRSKGIPTSANRGVRVSQLNLIDLAGSEKVATDVERRKEGGYINKSLLTLGNVISKLTSDEPSTHIPFRNSKLTRILQAALSGNARISVICTINPTFASKDESLNTLRFAQRAKLVKTAAKMTRILDNSELQNCLIKIAELQTKMQEKNDLEAETRERLKSLLGLILTSSKVENPEDDDQVSLFSQFANISADDLMKESTMRDVVAHCEQGFAAQIATHQKQMDKMALNLESMQDMMNIMESVHAKQNDTLSKRDAQIEKLKYELAQAKSALQVVKPTNTGTASGVRATKLPNVRATMTPGARNTMTPCRINVEREGLLSIPSVNTPVPTTTKTTITEEQEEEEPVSSLPTPIPTNKQEEFTITPALPTPTPTQASAEPTPHVIRLDDVTPAISLAVQHISEAISTGLKLSITVDEEDDEEYDMISSATSLESITDITQAISSVFQNVLSSTLLLNKDDMEKAEEQQQINIPKNTITTALQNAIQRSALSSSITATSSTSRVDFIPIHEAVLFVRLSTNYYQPLPVNIIEEDEAPELTTTAAVESIRIDDEQKEEEDEHEEEQDDHDEQEEEEEEREFWEKKNQVCNRNEDSEVEVDREKEALIVTAATDEVKPATTVKNQVYEPYSKSINQPIIPPLPTIINRWTIVCLAIYIVLQTN